jgi:hypothetical protein
MATEATVSAELVEKAIATIRRLQASALTCDHRRYENALDHLERLRDCRDHPYWELKAVESLLRLAQIESQHVLKTSVGIILAMVQQMFFPEAKW